MCTLGGVASREGLLRYVSVGVNREQILGWCVFAHRSTPLFGAGD